MPKPIPRPKAFRSYCPICGLLIEGVGELAEALSWAAHKCPCRVLAGIDGRRDDSDDEPVSDDPDRFEDGFTLIDLSGDDPDDSDDDLALSDEAS